MISEAWIPGLTLSIGAACQSGSCFNTFWSKFSQPEKSKAFDTLKADSKAEAHVQSSRGLPGTWLQGITGAGLRALAFQLGNSGHCLWVPDAKHSKEPRAVSSTQASFPHCWTLTSRRASSTEAGLSKHLLNDKGMNISATSEISGSVRTRPFPDVS